MDTKTKKYTQFDTEFMSLNCRKGYYSKRKYEQVKIKIEKYKPKIIFIQEAEIPKENFDEIKKLINVPGYKIITSNISYNRNYCIIAYVKVDLDVNVIAPFQAIVPTLTFEVKGDKTTQIVCNYYKPHSSSLDINTSNVEMTRNLVDEWNHLKVEYMRNDFILFGDSNIDWEREHFLDKQQMVLIDDFTTENGLKEILKSHIHTGQLSIIK